VFTISQGKGFQLTFKNGWTVSVQFGTGNYCERQNYQAKFESERNTRRWQSLTAEIAAWSALYQLEETARAQAKLWRNPDTAEQQKLEREHNIYSL